MLQSFWEIWILYNFSIHVPAMYLLRSDLQSYFTAFGTIISYVIMIGDTFTAIMQRLANGVPVISDRRFITVFLMCVIVFPLTLWKSVNKLRIKLFS